MKKPEFYLNENLRFLPKDSKALLDFIFDLQSHLTATNDPAQQASLLGELGVYYRTLDRFTEAEDAILKALEIVRNQSLGLAREVQQKIRLAHVYQEMKEFHRSNNLFTEILRTCTERSEAHPYLDFALQHAGKNEFDQQHYERALELFKQALNLRQEKTAPADQIESTKEAIRRTEERLRNQQSR